MAVRIYCSTCAHCEVTEVRKIRFDANFLFMCGECESVNILITHVREDEVKTKVERGEQ